MVALKRFEEDEGVHVDRTVACIQFVARRRESLEEFGQRVMELTAYAVECGAKMVLFPAYMGMAHLMAACPDAGLFLGPGLAKAVRSMWPIYGASLHSEFLGLFTRLARQFGVYVAPGTAFIPAPGGIHNTAYLISRDGSTVLTQAQTHLCRDERASGQVKADDLKVVDTDLGKVGFVICEDAWHPEVMRILALKGAEIVLAPVAVPRPYDEWHQVRGMWQNIQQNQAFGIEACLVGFLGGVEFEGRSTIYATCEMTEGDTGVLSRARRTDAGDVVAAELSFAAIRETINRFGIFDQFNVGLYRQWFPKVYYDRVAARSAVRAATPSAPASHHLPSPPGSAEPETATPPSGTGAPPRYAGNRKGRPQP